MSPAISAAVTRLCSPLASVSTIDRIAARDPGLTASSGAFSTTVRHDGASEAPWPPTTPRASATSVRRRRTARARLATRLPTVRTRMTTRERRNSTSACCARETAAWALAICSLSYTTIWPKSSGRSRPMASSSWAIWSAGSPPGLKRREVDARQQPGVLQRLEAAADDGKEVQRHLLAVHGEPVGLSRPPSRTRITAAWARSVAATMTWRVVSLGQHASQRFVDDRPHAADQDRRERRQLVGELLLDELLDVDRIEDLVGEEGGQRVGDLGLEQGLLDGVGDGGGVEQDLVGPHGDDADQHARPRRARRRSARRWSARGGGGGGSRSRRWPPSDQAMAAGAAGEEGCRVRASRRSPMPSPRAIRYTSTVMIGMKSRASEPARLLGAGEVVAVEQVDDHGDGDDQHLEDDVEDEEASTGGSPNPISATIGITLRRSSSRRTLTLEPGSRGWSHLEVDPLA